MLYYCIHSLTEKKGNSIHFRTMKISITDSNIIESFIIKKIHRLIQMSSSFFSCYFLNKKLSFEKISKTNPFYNYYLYDHFKILADGAVGKTNNAKFSIQKLCYFQNSFIC